MLLYGASHRATPRTCSQPVLMLQQRWPQVTPDHTARENLETVHRLCQAGTAARSVLTLRPCRPSLLVCGPADPPCSSAVYQQPQCRKLPLAVTMGLRNRADPAVPRSRPAVQRPGDGLPGFPQVIPGRTAGSHARAPARTRARRAAWPLPRARCVILMPPKGCSWLVGSGSSTLAAPSTRGHAFPKLSMNCAWRQSQGQTGGGRGSGG